MGILGLVRLVLWLPKEPTAQTRLSVQVGVYKRRVVQIAQRQSWEGISW